MIFIKQMLNRLLMVIAFWLAALAGIAQNGFLDLNVSNQTHHSGVHDYCSANCIISPHTPTQPVLYDNSAEVTYRAQSCIRLKDGFTAGTFSGNGKFHAYIDQGDFEVDLIEPAPANGTVGKYEKLELGIKLPADLLCRIDNYLSAASINALISTCDQTNSALSFINNNYQFCSSTNPLNPFDPDDIKVEATFKTLSGSQQFTRDGFFYRDYKHTYDPNSGKYVGWLELGNSHYFRVRMAPDELGFWEVAVKIILPGSGTVFESNCFIFECVPELDNKGFLQVGPHNFNLQFEETGESFFAIGENVFTGSAGMYGDRDNSVLEDYMEGQFGYMDELAGQGGDFLRIGADSYSYELEWESLGNYDTRMGTAWELDRFFDKAKDLDLHFILNLNVHHEFFIARVNGGSVWWAHPPRYYWGCHPHNSLVNGDMANYFTNVDVKKYMKQKLRYIVARWGYATHLAAYEIMDEIDQVFKDFSSDYYGDPSLQLEVKNWYQEMCDYVKSLDDKHLITGSIAGHENTTYNNNQMAHQIWDIPSLDITQVHAYSKFEDDNINRRHTIVADVFRPNIAKPFIFGELGPRPGGLYEDTGVTFHNNLWATAFMGGMGAGLNWFWQDVHEKNYHEDFKPLANFMDGEDFVNYDFIPMRGDAVDLRLENHYLRASSGERVIGWIHNRSYWAQNYASSFQIQDLIDLYTQPNPWTYDCNMIPTNGPEYCRYLVNPARANNTSFPYPWAKRDIQNVPLAQPFTNYPTNNDPCSCANMNSNLTIPFPTTNFDVVQPLNNSKMVIELLSPNTIYQVKFYRTRGANNMAASVLTQSYNTFGFNHLVINIPDTDDLNPDWAYKIERIGPAPPPEGPSEGGAGDRQSWDETAEQNTIVEWNVFPNPGKGLFYLELSKAAVFELEVYDLKGQTLLQERREGKTHTFDLSDHPPGVYLVKLRQGNQVLVKKIELVK